jgi:hypothetical protein
MEFRTAVPLRGLWFSVFLNIKITMIYIYSLEQGIKKSRLEHSLVSDYNSLIRSAEQMLGQRKAPFLPHRRLEN